MALQGVMEELISGRFPPGWLHESFMVLLPKGDDTLDDTASHDITRHAVKTRPVQLSNCDSKLLCCGGSDVAQGGGPGLLSGTARVHCRAGYSGRCSVFVCCGMEMRAHVGGSAAAAILLDMAEAFVSLAHGYQWAALRLKGTPPRALRLLTAVYKCNMARILILGVLGPRLPLRRGIRQGGTSSAGAWNIAYDPILRRIRALSPLSDHGLMSAFADDVGVATASLRRTARPLGSLGRRPAGTGLSLTTDKTEVLLLNVDARRVWADDFGDQTFFFRDARTPDQARCLGFQLRVDLGRACPSAHCLAPVAPIRDRSAHCPIQLLYVLSIPRDWVTLLTPSRNLLAAERGWRLLATLPRRALGAGPRRWDWCHYRRASHTAFGDWVALLAAVERVPLVSATFGCAPCWRGCRIEMGS